MPRNWSMRAKALAHFEKQLRDAKRFNDDDKEMIEEVVNALRRSTDHTAIQSKLTSAIRCIRSIAEMPASTHAIDMELCREWLNGNTSHTSGAPHG